jgi:hypothetical protein
MNEINIKTKTNPDDDKLVDLFVNDKYSMTMIDGCKTPEGEKAIERMAREMADEIDREIVERIKKSAKRGII